MRAGALLLMVVLVGCAAAATELPSPAGLTTVVVQGKAKNIVLVDSRGRTSRSDARVGEIPIPDCTRWDGGNETTLDDSSDAEADGSGDIATQIELSKPMIGRYRLYADVAKDGETSVVVTPVTSTTANSACPQLKQAGFAGGGRCYWTIEFLPASGKPTCPVRVLRAVRSQVTR